jgi:hypothetical protein
MGGTVWLVIMLLTAQKDGIATAIEKVPMSSLKECHAIGSALKDESIDIKYFCLKGSNG